MAQSFRCLNVSLRAIEKAPVVNALAPPRTASGFTRRCIHSSCTVQQAQAQLAHKPEQVPERQRAYVQHADSYPRTATHSVNQQYPRPDAPSRAPLLVQHLESLFSPLQFPQELARRVLTHASHRDAVNGHNARFSFIGRRVLAAYMHTFLASAPRPEGKHVNAEEVAERVLNTYCLGEFVGVDWQLGRVVRWTPPEAGAGAHREPGDEFDDRRRPQFGEDGKKVWRGTVGFYKVTGTTVEAIIGGIFHQHGGTAARHVFHTRILPRILAAQRVPVSADLLRHANEVSVKMGGQPQSRETEQPVEQSS
ncbi:hypothetical protein PUNSTDRAFT_86813, partial [Punctularia strigosozonata HHB-11173 SS5]|uniref:uncharacterized protein n=1 Tax=Punctularia strigosozonata (strain HHB-11173) TaxID=741275 RepID=UPI0004417817